MSLRRIRINLSCVTEKVKISIPCRNIHAINLRSVRIADLQQISQFSQNDLSAGYSAASVGRGNHCKWRAVSGMTRFSESAPSIFANALIAASAS